MNVNCVEMRLVHALIRMDGNTFETNLCISKDYKKPSYIIETAENYVAWYKGKSNYDVFKGTALENDINKMIVFDYIIGNLDRHGMNFEIIVNKNKLAPLFDNGNSLSSTRADAEIASMPIPNDNMSNSFIGDRSLLQNVYMIKHIADIKMPSDLAIETIVNKHRMLLGRVRTDYTIRFIKERRDNVWKILNTHKI